MNKYILAGHSHAHALGLPHSADPTPALVPIRGGSVLGLTGAFPRISPEYWTALAQNARDAKVIIVWQGARHLAYFLFEAGNRFDFYMLQRQEIPLLDGASLVPETLVREFIDVPNAHLRKWLAVLKAVPGCTPVVIGTPPPKGNDARLRTMLSKEPFFCDALKAAGEPASDVRFTDPFVRFKLWLLSQDLLRESAESARCIFIPAPTAVMDEHGFLKEELWHEDVTHANSLYGEICWEAIMDTVL